MKKQIGTIFGEVVEVAKNPEIWFEFFNKIAFKRTKKKSKP